MTNSDLKLQVETDLEEGSLGALSEIIELSLNLFYFIYLFCHTTNIMKNNKNNRKNRFNNGEET